jgi:hypothetical protein
MMKQAKQQGVHIEVLENKAGDLNGTLLSATMMATGNNLDAFVSDWAGTIQWIAQSPYRKYHKRKNWFVGIATFDIKELMQWNPKDAKLETCRWGKARGFTSGQAQMYYMQHDDAYLDYVPFEEPAFEVILMSGLPGAGKNTFIKKRYPDRPVISLDNMRTERGTSPTDKTGNGQIIQEAKEQARVYLRRKESFVWNATIPQEN